MKYLKLFENHSDIDPFDEDNWDEDEFSTNKIHYDELKDGDKVKIINLSTNDTINVTVKKIYHNKIEFSDDITYAHHYHYKNNRLYDKIDEK